MSNATQPALNRNLKLLSEKTSVSNSAVFSQARKYYTQEGPEAWKKNIVPSFVTSNCVIARAYAESVFAYMVDYLSQHPDTATNEPFYIIEMCTGHGKLSYYVINVLLELAKNYGYESTMFQYVLTDISQKNLDSWLTHHALSGYINDGIIDYALFEVETDTSITLQRSKKTLSPGCLNKPIILFGNYSLDTLAHDVFQVRKKNLYESQVTVYWEEQSNPLACLNYEYQDVAVPTPIEYYQDKNLNQVLEQYQKNFEDSQIIIPVGGFRAINNVKAWTNKEIMVLLADKGYHSSKYFPRASTPHIAEHGSISFMVNFDSIRRYFELQGGFCCLPQEPTSNFHVCMFTTGSLTQYPRLQHAANYFLLNLSPEHYFQLQKIKTEPNIISNPNWLLSLLKLSNNDPYMLFRLGEPLLRIVKNLSPIQADSLNKIIRSCWQNYFMLEEAHNVALIAGKLMTYLGNYELAGTMLEFAKKHFPQQKVEAERWLRTCKENLTKKK